MSSLHVKNIDSQVTSRQLRSVFSQFGSITELSYSPCPEKKHNGKARIEFRDANSALQACEFDNYCLEDQVLDVSIIDGKNGDRKPSFVHKKLFSEIEIIVILVIAAISFLVRVRNIAEPGLVVFDEKKTGYWINSYITGKRYFDWDPPLAKIIFAGYAKLVGYHADFDFRNQTLPENQYTGTFYIKLRMFPCICGSLVAPIIVAAMLLRFHSIPSVLVAGLLLSIDFQSIVQSRFIVVDSIVYLFVALTIFFSCLLYRKNTWMVAFWQTFFACCAFSSRFIAGTVFIFVIVTHYRANYHQKHGIMMFFLRSIFLVWLALMALWFSMCAHLALTPKWGEGDRYTSRTLRKQPMSSQVPLIIYDMIKNRRDDGLDHPYQSRWFDWPIFKSIPSLVWSTEIHDRVICAFNNPATALGSVIGVLVCFLYGKWDWTFGYCATYFIYAFVKRATWSTSYEIPLIFGICSLSAALDRMHKPFRYAFYVMFVLGSIYAFNFWNSWIYGIVQTPLELSERTIWPRLRSLWRVQ